MDWWGQGVSLIITPILGCLILIFNSFCEFVSELLSLGYIDYHFVPFQSIPSRIISNDPIPTGHSLAPSLVITDQNAIFNLQHRHPTPFP